MPFIFKNNTFWKPISYYHITLNLRHNFFHIFPNWKLWCILNSRHYFSLFWSLGKHHHLQRTCGLTKWVVVWTVRCIYLKNFFPTKTLSKGGVCLKGHLKSKVIWCSLQMKHKILWTSCSVIKGTWSTYTIKCNYRQFPACIMKYNCKHCTTLYY